MNRKYIHTILIACTMSGLLKGQSQRSPEQIVGDLIELVSQGNQLTGPNNQAFEDLLDIINDPIPINNTSINELEQLIFLTPIQIQNLSTYISNQKVIHSIYQLQGVEGFSIETLKTLNHFIKFDETISDTKSKYYLKGQVIVRDIFDLETPIAYGNDSIEPKYLGNKHHLYSRIQLQYGTNWHAGTTIDKDPGERLFQANTNYVDFQSAYLQYHGKRWLKTVILGDYNVNIGQGLALWTGTAMGKNTEVLNIIKRGKKISKYSSANEYAFFRGIASNFSINNIDLTVFSNYKKRDAAISWDENNTKIITSLPETGYHRTNNELLKKNTLTQQSVGADVDINLGAFKIGFGGYYNSFTADSIVTNQLYKRYTAPKINSNNYWLNYKYSYQRLMFFGEVASTSDMNTALLNGLLFTPQNNISISLLHRHISKKYNSIYTNAFTEYSSTAGESGIYFGIITFPTRNIEVSAYFDYFKSSWLQYQINAPSNGYDYMLNINYRINSQFSVYLRYKEKEKARNISNSNKANYTILPANQKKVRLHATFNSSEKSRIQFRYENTIYSSTNISSGYLSYIDYKYSWKNDKLSMWLRYTIFDTDDYYSRIYTYENDLLYSFYTPAFQNDGTRFYIQFRWKLIDALRLWTKFSQTWYNHKTEIGSGDYTINGNSRTNLKIQLQYVF